MTFDTRIRICEALKWGVALPGASANHCKALRAGDSVNAQASSILKPRVLMLSIAIAASLSACKQDDAASTTAEPAAQAAPALTLDESKLPPFNQFKATDLDSTKNACTDFGGYINGKWLAANAIPGDRTSWALSKCWASDRSQCSSNWSNRPPR